MSLNLNVDTTIDSLEQHSFNSERLSPSQLHRVISPLKNGAAKFSVRAYPAEALKQFNEMVLPRAVLGESDRRLIEKENSASIALINKLSVVTDEDLQQLLKTIDQLDFENASSNSILLSPQLPYVALEALRRGMLDPKHGQKQVATLLNFWSALQYHKDPKELQTISIFNPQAKFLMMKTFLISPEPSLEPFLAEEKFELFMKKIEALPASEQRFLLVPDIQGEKPTELKKIFDSTISQRIKAVGVNVFNRLDLGGKEYRMIPSLGMMQSFLEAQYGNDAVQIKPRIYHSTARQVYETRLNNTCEMMLPTPDSQGNSRCPPRADGFPAPWYDFPAHDFYHAILNSAVGPTYRKVGIIASDAIRAYAQTVPVKDRKGLHQIAFQLVDMEYSAFHHFIKSKPNPEQLIWLIIADKINTHASQIIIQRYLIENGVTPPNENSPISKESEVGIFKAIYQALVHQQKGPPELSEKSFKAAAMLYKIQIMKEYFEDLDHKAVIARRNHSILRFERMLSPSLKIRNLAHAKL